jgi:hypothetical protein
LAGFVECTLVLNEWNAAESSKEQEKFSIARGKVGDASIQLAVAVRETLGVDPLTRETRRLFERTVRRVETAESAIVSADTQSDRQPIKNSVAGGD